MSPRSDEECIDCGEESDVADATGFYSEINNRLKFSEGRTDTCTSDRAACAPVSWVFPLTTARETRRKASQAAVLQFNGFIQGGRKVLESKTTQGHRMANDKY